MRFYLNLVTETFVVVVVVIVVVVVVVVHIYACESTLKYERVKRAIVIIFLCNTRSMPALRQTASF